MDAEILARPEEHSPETVDWLLSVVYLQSVTVVIAAQALSH